MHAHKRMFTLRGWFGSGNPLYTISHSAGCWVVVGVLCLGLRSYQDGYWLVTVRIHGDVGCPTGSGTPSCQQRDLISHAVTLSWHWAHQSFPCPNNAEHLTRKWQVSNVKSLVGFDQGLNLWVWIPWSTNTGERSLTHFAISSGQVVEIDYCGKIEWWMGADSWGDPVDTMALHNRYHIILPQLWK